MRRRAAVGAGVAALGVAGVVGVAALQLRAPEAGAGAALYPLAASGDGDSLVTAQGDPFLYLADTVWLAPSRLDQAELRELLDVRAAQGFTTVQVSVLPFVHLDGGTGNAFGVEGVRGTDLSSPVEVGERTDDPDGPDYDYWDHLDVFLEMAAERGMQLALVPSWYGFEGEDWRGYVDEESAAAYGSFLGRRLGTHPNLLWLLGGDNDPVGDDDRVPDDARRGDVVRATHAMATAIRENEAVPHPMSYHASRTVSSLEHFPDADWHTFVSAYSDESTWRRVADSSGSGRPVVMTEAYYDGREREPLLDRTDLRSQAWWSVLGGAGYAYGHEDVWDLDPGHGPDSDGGADSWQRALEAPSARDMTVLAETVADLLPLRPRDGVVVAGRGDGDSRAAAAVSADRRTVLVYLPDARTVEVDLGDLEWGATTATWLDPADGTRHDDDEPEGGLLTLRPPADLDDDAVLVLRRR